MTARFRLQRGGITRTSFGTLRWRIIARWPDGAWLLVAAETSDRGFLFDIQAGDLAGTTGSSQLDAQVVDWIQGFLAHSRGHRAIGRLPGRWAQ